MIELRNVDFSYGDNPILRDVSFSVASGESLIVLGPSGSGKSTVLRLILGLECPQNGQVLIGGRNICSMSESDKREIRKKIGMVFQEGALFDSLTVGENVGYYLLEHTKMKLPQVEEKVRMMLGFVGLDADELIDKLPDQLSGGMKRRVAIGRALLSTDPKVMLYDEPTTGLDPQSNQNVLNLIRKLQAERSICTILVTQQIADAVGLADRSVVIVEGRVVFDGTLDQMRDSDDSKVISFLAPFRRSLSRLADRKFVDPGRPL